MENNIKLFSNLDQYIEFTKEAIKAFEENKLDLGEDFIDKRQLIIDEIKDMNLNSSEFLKYKNKDNLKDLDRKLNEIIKQKLEDTKLELSKLHKSKRGNYNYGNMERNKLEFFNQKA